MFSLRKLLVALAAQSVLAPVPGFSQQPTFHDALLDHLVGNWVLEGTIAKKKTTHDIDAQWVMGHQYLRFHEVSRDPSIDGKPAYEATVFIGWDGDLKQYACVWLDTYGDVSPVSLANAIPDGDEIKFVFKDKDELFRTTFAFHAATDTWEMSMDSDSKGVLSSFAHTTLTRAK